MSCLFQIYKPKCTQWKHHQSKFDLIEISTFYTQIRPLERYNEMQR